MLEAGENPGYDGLNFKKLILRDFGLSILSIKQSHVIP
jgi:hypothetical protein